MRWTILLFIAAITISVSAQKSAPNRRNNFQPVSGGASSVAGTNYLFADLAVASVNTANQVSYNTPSFTPSSNATLFTYVVATDAAPIADGESVTNTGTTQLTWWLAGRTNFNVIGSPVSFISLWVAQLPQGTTPFSMTVVCNLNNAGTGGAIGVVEVVGADQTAANGTNAVVQTTKFAVDATANPTNKWAAPGNGGFNMILVGHGSDTAAIDPTLSWTELIDTNYATPTSELAIYYSNAVPSTVLTITNTDGSADWGTIAVEVKAGTNMLASACGTFGQSTRTGTTLGTEVMGSGAAETTYTATVFTNVSSSICNITAQIARVGSPSFNLTGYIYSEGGGKPGTLLYTGSTVAASTIATFESPVRFTFTGTSLSTSTPYWFVLKVSAAGDGSNNLLWSYNEIFLQSGIQGSDDGTTWNPPVSRIGQITTFTP